MIQGSEEILEAIVWACVNLPNYLRACDESVATALLDMLTARVSQAPQLMADAAKGSALSDVSHISASNASKSKKAVRKFPRYFCSSSGELF